MAAVFPSGITTLILANLLQDEDILVKLFSNNVTPDVDSTISSFTEVTGGGYTQQTLDPNTWVITPGDPSVAENVQCQFSFTGVPSGPGTVYGYYVVHVINGYMWAERFEGAVTPLRPITGSMVKINTEVECV